MGEAKEKMAGRDIVEAVGRRLPQLREAVRSRTEWRAVVRDAPGVNIISMAPREREGCWLITISFSIHC